MLGGGAKIEINKNDNKIIFIDKKLNFLYNLKNNDQ